MLLELEGVTSYYGKTPILQNVSLGVAHGHCMAVLGRNGVGKTTLMRTIMGLTTQMTGTLRIAGEDASNMPTHQRSEIGIGYIPQGRGILPKFSVRENILLGTFARNDKRRKIPDMCLDLFPYLAENLDKRAGQLSGGQQQQLAISRALATDPKILLLDEPTEGIQPSIVEEIVEILKTLQARRKLTVVLVEQNLDFIAELSQRVLIIQRGQFTSEVSPDQLSNPDLVAEFVGMGG